MANVVAMVGAEFGHQDQQEQQQQAEVVIVTRSRSPQSLYNYCLKSYVRNLSIIERDQLIRLPSFVLIDIFHTMSEDCNAHNEFQRQLHNINLWGKLLSFRPGRQKLFTCLSTVSRTHKTCVPDLADEFIRHVDRRYDFISAKGSSNVILKRFSSQKRRQLNYAFFHYEDEDRNGIDGGEFQMDDERDTNNEDYFYRTDCAIDRQVKEPSPVLRPLVSSVIRLVRGGLEGTDKEREKSKASVIRDEIKATDGIWDQLFARVNQGYDGTNESVDEEHDPVLEKLLDANEIVHLIQQAPYMKIINVGLQIGAFLTEAGWLNESIKVFQKCLDMITCLGDHHYEYILLRLDCLQRILYVQSRFCLFDAANRTSVIINRQIAVLLRRNQRLPPPSLLAMICKERALMHIMRSEYDMSYSWSVRALHLLRHPNIPERVTIDVLLQAGKSCVVKRHFKRANMLITFAVKRTLLKYGKHNQKYADALLDYGFYLLNVDLIINSVNMYNEALEIKLKIFGEMNLYVGIAHEDLAYALYVKEYSSGEFYPARDHIEKAIAIMTKLVPPNHLMLASAKRVKALILEEIALDNAHSPNYKALLEESEELHETALRLSLAAFGEINVQTAKHYGNLGRLYQSMTKFEAAEQMHKRAIKIKTDLLGAYDYEVGLSIGHLASLYNYQMQKHHEAEELYMKSIDISLRLFGETYSGLEYDYRGLCHIYDQLHDVDRYLEYSRILDNWRNLRLINDEVHVNQLAFVEMEDDAQMEEVIMKFFEFSKGSSNEALAIAVVADVNEMNQSSVS